MTDGAAPSPALADPAGVPAAGNVARALARTGTLIGAALLTGTVVDGARLEGHEGAVLGAVAWMFVFGAAGILLLVLSTGLANLLFLGAALRAEIRRGNVAAGLISAGHAVALGLILGACFYGRTLQSLAVSATFFLIGVATLLILQRLYRALTRYADDQETLGENSAAALGFVGVTLAFAIIVAHAADGTFVGWAPSLRGYGRALLLALALFPVRQLVVGPLLLRVPVRRRGGRTLDRLVGQERNVVVGAIEAAAYVAMALLATGIG